MQEVREEMTRRIASLKRQTEHCEAEITERQDVIAELEQRIQTGRVLAEQYQTVLDSLAETPK
jgi:prefoldin subunit 5